MRAVLAAQAAMEAAGFAPEPGAARPEGWIRPGYANSPGYGIRASGANLEWNVHLAGENHMRWDSYDQAQGEDTVRLHEPVDPERLEGPIRAVFEGLGLDVREVRVAGWHGMWDRQVSYVVVTDHPDWLEDCDPQNRPQAAPGPVLQGYAMRQGFRGAVPLRGVLPGYDIGGEPHLTRESIEALAAATAGSWGISYALDKDGTLVTSRDGRALSRAAPVTHVNHWGDAVQVWPVNRLNLDPAPLEGAAADFVLDGEMRRKAPFALYDAQYGDAPWSGAAPSPAP